MATPVNKVILTEDQLKQVDALGQYLSIEQLCDHLGIAKSTFYEIAKEGRQPELLVRYKKSKAKAIADIAEGLTMAARNGCATRQMFYLKTQAGWKETSNIDHSSSDGSMSPPANLNVQFLDDDK